MFVLLLKYLFPDQLCICAQTFVFTGQQYCVAPRNFAFTHSPPRNFVQNICILLQQCCIPREKHSVLSQNNCSPEKLFIPLQMFSNMFFFFLAKLLCFPSKLCFCSQNFCDMDVKTMKYIFSSLVPLRLCRNLPLHLQLEC